MLEALALKPAFAIRRLATAALEVRSALAADALDAARDGVGRHLVSRDVRGLDGPAIASAAVESVAENVTDSVAAPLLAYAAGGLPAAWGYRVLNTADAMWGYRDARYERFGKVAARLDDAANLLPARCAAAALVGGAALAGEDAAGAARTAWRDHGRTASPNAGWPMAAMAGALGVALEKRQTYRLGDGALPASPAAVDRAVRVFAGAAALVVGPHAPPHARAGGTDDRVADDRGRPRAVVGRSRRGRPGVARRRPRSAGGAAAAAGRAGRAGRGTLDTAGAGAAGAGCDARWWSRRRRCRSRCRRSRPRCRSDRRRHLRP